MARSVFGSPRRRPDSFAGLSHHGPECSCVSGIPREDVPDSLGEFPKVSGPAGVGSGDSAQVWGDNKMWPWQRQHPVCFAYLFVLIFL